MQGNHSLNYRRDIDGLRAVAVGAVLLFHAFPKLLPGGFAGVDIFFVISGYLISSIVIKDVARGAFSIVHFYDRRVRRIFPALAAVLATTLVLGYMVMLSREFRTLGAHVAAAAGFVENFVLWGESGYFDVASDRKPLLHLWSLAIEEQFYLVWPLLLLVGSRFSKAVPRIIAALGVASFAVSVWLAYTDVTAAYYSPASRFWELMIGGWLAYAARGEPIVLGRGNNIRSVAGALLVASGFALLSETRKFPGFWALLPTVGTALMLAAGPGGLLNRSVLSERRVVYLGKISYPLYLWHWITLAFLAICKPVHSWKWTLAAAAVSVALAAFTYHVIEAPFRRSSTGRARDLKPVYLIVAIAMLGLAGALVNLTRVSPRIGGFETAERNEWDLLFEKNGLKSNAKEQGRFDLNAQRLGLTVFLGDSHVAHYAERVYRVQQADPKANGARFYVGGGCSPIENVRTDQRDEVGCPQLLQAGLAAAAQASQANVVVGGSWSWLFIYGDYYYLDGARRLPLREPEGRARALAQLRSELEALRRPGRKVFLLVGSYSSVDLDPIRRAPRLSLTLVAPILETIAIEPAQLRLREEILRIARESGATPVDPTVELCKGDKCPWATTSGMPIYRDSGHLNPDWVVAHATFIDPTLR